MKKLHVVLAEVDHCEKMWAAAGLSASQFYIICKLDSTRIPRDSKIRVRDVRDCIADLENAYLVRLFAVFESHLRGYWHDVMKKKTNPKVSVLMDRVAGSCFMQNCVLERAHKLREYRNHLVHGSPASRMDIPEAKSAANSFLSRLIGIW